MSASHDFRLVPVASFTWVGAWVGVSGWRPEPGVLFAVAGAVVLVAVLAARSRHWWVAVCLVVLLASGLAAGALSWQRHGSPVAMLAGEGATGTVEFAVSAVPRQAAGAVVVEVRLRVVESRGRRLETAQTAVLIGSGEREAELTSLTVGARYRAVARLAPAERDDEEAAVLSLRSSPEQTQGPGRLQAAAESLRQGLRDAMAHSPPGQAALVPSLVVGDTSAIDAQTTEQFRVTGLTHLMAVSGANLSLMLGVVLAVVKAAGVRGWAIRAAGATGVAGFVVLCGNEPSVLRSAAMGIVALASLGAGRGRRSLRALSLAVFLLLWLDPWLARSVGFALSVVACAGIVSLGPLFISSLTRWCPRWLAEALAVPLAAQLATQPLVTGISDQVSVVGVLANVLAGPFVGPTTVLGFAAAFASPLPMLAVGPAWVAGWCAQPILWLAAVGASLPSAAWEWQASPLGVLLVVLGCGALAVALVATLRTPWGGGVFVAVLVAGCLVRPVAPGWPGRWEAVFCDVGQGDATVVRAGERAAVLVDTGPEPAPTIACLASLGIDDVPLLVLTHYHADHTGGAVDVIARYRPELILVRDGEVPAWLGAAAAEAGSTVRHAEPGETLAVGQAQWVTVSTDEAPAVMGEEGEGSQENDASIVAVAASGGLRVLLPGDAEPAGQADALRAAASLGLDLSAQVLKLPHHGSARQEPRFFAATGAALAVASAGRDNDYGHPAQAALALADEQGMQVARTDLQGSIAVSASADGLVVRAGG